MMKRICPTFVRWRGLILTIAVVLCGLLESAHCGIDDAALVLEQVPLQGGRITPDVGIHHFGLYTDVTLTAVSKPGYQFVYWLGDVSDPTANRTTVYLDAPKIVIAVFERAKHELLTPGVWPYSASAGGVFVSAADYGRTAYTGGGRKRPHKPTRWTLPPSEEEPEGDFPVPEGPEGDFPVPVPEPAAVCLLGLGGLILLRKRRTK
jgi:hypothetical protein